MGVAHTKELDRQNNNTMLMDALAKEMYNGGVAFEVLDIRQQAPNGWKKVTGHIVWDVKMALTRKARWVLHGHKMPDPVGSTFIRVVSSKAYGSLSPMLCSMDWISLQQTLGMHIYRLPNPRRTTLFVVLSLGLKMWDVWYSH